MDYITAAGRGTGVYEEKKSRFLGEAIPVESEEEIREHLARIRKEYYDARHHCYAYVLGEKRMERKASDDGEPSGTAGLPILGVIDGASMTNVLVVVTRYFGGTLLGTGGLVRAYTEAARLALSDARPVQMSEGEELLLTMDYPLYDRVSYYLRTNQIQTGEIRYTDKVAIPCTLTLSGAEKLRKDLSEQGSGRILIESTGRGHFAFDIAREGV